MSRPGGGKGSFFWEASPSTYPLIGKSRDLLPTGRDRTANLWAPFFCKSYLFFAREVCEASLHWGDSDLFNSTTTTCTQSSTSNKKKETINTIKKEVFLFLEAKRPSRAIVKLSSSSCRARLYSRYSRGKLARYSC